MKKVKKQDKIKSNSISWSEPDELIIEWFIDKLKREEKNEKK